MRRVREESAILDSARDRAQTVIDYRLQLGEISSRSAASSPPATSTAALGDHERARLAGNDALEEVEQAAREEAARKARRRRARQAAMNRSAIRCPLGEQDERDMCH